MVYFVCEGCQETLKKNQVDGHAARCNGCWAVSCVDCSKVFEGNTYAQHTSCISEAEKYEKSVYKGPKGSKKKKKRNPQEEWMDIIMEAAAEARGGPSAGGQSNLVKTYLPRMADMGNVPRNEKKFKNFVSNSLRLHRQQDQAELWSFLEKRRAALAAASAEEEAAAEAQPQEEGTAQQASESEDKKAGKESKLKKRSAPGSEGDKEQQEQKEDKEVVQHKEGGEEEESPKKKGKKAVVQAEPEGNHGEVCDFNWGPVIKKLVKKADNRQMALKQLRKAVIAFASEEGQSLPEEKKALKKMLLVKVEEVEGLSLQDGVVCYHRKAT